MEISISCYNHNKQRVVVPLSDYCQVLTESLKEVLFIPGFQNVQTTKWAEHNGEVANFSIAEPNAITFTIKIKGKVADLMALNNLLCDSVGNYEEQVIIAEYRNKKGQIDTINIPAEYVKISSFSALSRNGQIDETFAIATLELKCSKNEYYEDSQDYWWGVLSNYTTNGKIARKSSGVRSIQGGKFNFYEMNDTDLESLRTITDPDDFVDFRSWFCLGSNGMTVLKGYYNSISKPTEQNQALNIKTLETDIVYRSNSTKHQATDIALKLLIKGEDLTGMIESVGILKRYCYKVCKLAGNYLVFVDESSNLAFACYPKACSVDKFNSLTNMAEITLTMRATEVVDLHFEQEKVPAPAPEQEEQPLPTQQYKIHIAVGDYVPSLIKNDLAKVKLQEFVAIYDYPIIEDREVEYIPKGALLVDEIHYNKRTVLIFTFPPLLSCGYGLSVWGVVTEDIPYTAFDNQDTWRNSIATKGSAIVPQEVIKNFELLNLPMNCNVKFEYNGLWQERWTMEYEMLRLEAKGESSTTTWQNYFSEYLWNELKTKLKW